MIKYEKAPLWEPFHIFANFVISFHIFSYFYRKGVGLIIEGPKIEENWGKLMEFAV